MSQPVQTDFNSIAQHFRIEGQFVDARPYGFGHINDTYAARFRKVDGRNQRYILQRINHNVFKRPEDVMHNMELVTEHMRAKITDDGGDAARETVTLIPTVDGKSYCKSSAGDYWRVCGFIEGARTYLKAEHLDHYYHAAKAFGRFLAMLSDFPTGQLYETIPDFHHTPKRFLAFIEAVEKDAHNRAKSVRPEIEFVLQRADETGVLIRLLEAGAMPERVIHNDAKLDNVMIDIESGEGICVIDLDTVMPGLAVLDFGDSVRSAANPAVEDEQDLSKVFVDIKIFERLAHGFLDEVRYFLSPIELDHLAFGAKLITLEQSIRFLTDHINGDVYYKIDRENHNLDRCRTQIKMVRDMEAKLEQMSEIVERYR
ncbi:MAG: phosphotransferase [Chloroflexi bacterium]|jgi:Ser/Thr protein kinase RdoA (MazF antagonist)|nr:phosphotransferase [Chloroflexota bacterium]